MKHKILVEEQFSSMWKMIGYGTSAAALVFFILFLLTADPLWKGIFRFIAFIAFIGAVFSFLRLREGQKKVQIEFLDDEVLVTYYKKNERIKEELFERQTIKEVYKKEVNPLSGLSSIQKGYEFFITFTDTDNTLPMFEFSGRNLHFSKKTAAKLDRFMVQQLNENTNSSSKD